MKIPLKEFFKNREKHFFLVSPDYKKIGFLDNYKNRINIHVLDINTKEVTIITKQQKRNIGQFWWKNNDKIIFLQDNNGDENDHVFVVDIKTKKQKDITPGKELKVSSVNPLNTLVHIDKIEKYKDKILVHHNERDARTFDKYFYNLHTGEKELIQEFKPGVQEILSDKETLKTIYHIETIVGGTNYFKKGKFIKNVSSKDTFNIIDFTSNDKKSLYVLSNIGRDKIALFYADLELNIISEPIYENKNVDLDSVKLDYYTKKLQYVRFQEEKQDIIYFDKELENKHNTWRNKLIEKFPHEKDSIIVVSSILGTDEKIVGFDSFSDRKLRDEYFYFVDKEEILKMTNDQKYLNTENLVKMEPISYIARDGLKIHGYLSLPKNSKGPIPIIVNPHGGPWVRDSWRYNPEVQYFANRGYGVLQMNFRISTGYGKEHFLKGWHQWGLNCQHDITDGTKWLIEQNYTKPGMIAIYGGSYGGYATLMGIINEPNLYSAAVDYVGVSDLFTFWDGFPEYWKIPGTIFEEALGNPYDNKEYAEKVSPTYRADEIKTPLMVVQGAQDPRVPIKQSEQIVEALTKNGVAVEYIVKEDEGHGFSNQENKFELYERMIKFFDKHLK